MRRVAAALVVLALAGCSWFARKPAVVAPVAPVAAMPIDATPIEPVSAARAACTNYDVLRRVSPFPRSAIIRGIDAGTASVVFEVDGTKVTVLSVTSSSPSFGAAAADITRELRCAVARPTRFPIAFEWRTVR